MYEFSVRLRQVHYGDEEDSTILSEIWRRKMIRLHAVKGRPRVMARHPNSMRKNYPSTKMVRRLEFKIVNTVSHVQEYKALLISRP